MWRDFGWPPYQVSHGTGSQQRNTEGTVCSRDTLQSDGKRSLAMDCFSVVGSVYCGRNYKGGESNLPSEIQKVT